MSKLQHDDECPDCRPMLMDIKTGRPLPDDHPAMQAMQRAWLRTTLEQRQAFHRCTCLNSRAPHDLTLVKQFLDSVNRKDH